MFVPAPCKGRSIVSIWVDFTSTVGREITTGRNQSKENAAAD
jgi:hypothetical protein